MSKKIKNLSVTKIDKEYVKDDYAQVMLSFPSNLKILFEGNALFSLDKRNSGYTNQYLRDQRKDSFPYSNIPVHKEIRGLRVHWVTNQILEFNKKYLLQSTYTDIFGESNNAKRYCYLTRDDEGALLVIGDDCPELTMDSSRLKSLASLGKLKINKQKDPVFLRLINRHIPKEEIEKAKALKKEHAK